jgi:molecular chaperone DnaJ
VQKERTLAVKIPAGVEDGTRIRLAGEGDMGMRNGPPGDLYLFISVKPHHLFERDGADLYCRAPAPMCKAALGGEMEIPTIDGERAKITIPSGAQTGRRFRIKGKGMTHLRGKDRGDLHVELLVETPVNLTAKQRKLLEEFAKDCSEEAHPQSQGFFDSVKKFFETAGEPPTR